MVYCSVALCRNGNWNRADLSFFRFPTDKRLSIWLKFCRRADSKFEEEQRKAIAGKENNLRICNEHFTDDSYQKTLNGRRTLSDYAIPAVFRIYNKPETTTRNERYEKRAEKRTLPRVSDVKTTKKAKAQSAANTSTADIGSIHNDHPMQKRQAVIRSPRWEDNQEELIRLRKENEELRQKLQDKPTIKRELFMEDVLKSDESVRFYTGVPSLSCLQMLSELLRPEAEKLKYWDRNKGKTMAYQTSGKKKPGPKGVLKVEEEFVMTLVRLRLGLMGRNLADIFSVSPSQVSRIVTTWVCFLSATFKETLLLWPSKEEVRKNLPRSFKRYPNTRIIIDCTEMFIEKPTSPYAQRATWSDYKEHNTIKALVGITPSGYFSFLSEFWTGSTTDRRITQESGLVDLLEEGDAFMADRGFNIRDILTKKKVYLNIPPFSKKGIHVERAIERLKDFKIFQGNIPLTLVPLANHLLIVCGGLCNLLEPLA
ncbi:PREDICTED: uncharacterized protein LOC107348807 [Acropora digitifera]|uniref:uncharacterized protein LOC107348807 n=1 Tax=Acropora digitifera TaxID=70779 RepID=UPI00077AFA94|nr:PREDICTED: uncharacterized protein LOC107348807 [Acropora digitifera]